MARIDMPRLFTSVGIGAVDEALEFVDRQQNWTEAFRNVTDWGRALAVLGGGAGVMFSRGGQALQIYEQVLYSGSTLAVKSASRIVREGFATQMSPLRRRATPAGHRALPGGRNGIAASVTGRNRLTQEEILFSEV